MKKIVSSLVIAGLLVTTMLSGVAVAESNTTLLDQLDAIRNQSAIYESQQGELQQQAESSAQGVADLQAKLVKQQAEVTAAKQRLEGIEEKVARLKTDRDKFIYASYVGGNDQNLLYAMVQSSSLSDFLNRGHYTLLMLDKKTEVLEGVDEELQKLDREKRDLVTKQNTFENEIGSLQQRINDINARLAQNQSNLDAARQLEASLMAMSGNYNNNDRSWLRNNEPLGETITFIGGGTEHGLGMSQYGAKGAAQNGKDYRAILSHYYQGTTITDLGENPTVNVGGDLETYLVGVVEAEMNSNWPMEALKAQAVAARSYAYINRSRLDNSQRTQAWVGPGLQTDNARRAVAETRGQVLSYGGSVVAAYFHSTSGGHTENNENVWGGTPLRWLRGVPSPWETDSPHWEWRTKSYSKAELSGVFAKDDRTNVGSLQTIRIKGRGVGGRVTSVELVGSGGNKTVSGPTFKTVFNNHTPAGDPILRDTLFAFI